MDLNDELPSLVAFNFTVYFRQFGHQATPLAEQYNPKSLSLHE